MILCLENLPQSTSFMCVPSTFLLQGLETSACHLLCEYVNLVHSTSTLLPVRSFQNAYMFIPLSCWQFFKFYALLMWFRIKFEFLIVSYTMAYVSWPCMPLYFQLLSFLLTYAHTWVIPITFRFRNRPSSTTKTELTSFTFTVVTAIVSKSVFSFRL